MYTSLWVILLKGAKILSLSMQCIWFVIILFLVLRSIHQYNMFLYNKLVRDWNNNGQARTWCFYSQAASQWYLYRHKLLQNANILYLGDNSTASRWRTMESASPCKTRRSPASVTGPSISVFRPLIYLPFYMSDAVSNELFVVLPNKIQL